MVKKLDLLQRLQEALLPRNIVAAFTVWLLDGILRGTSYLDTSLLSGKALTSCFAS